LDTEPNDVPVARWSRLRALPDKVEQFEHSAPGRFWSQLSAGAVFGRMWNDWQAERALLDNQSRRD
jgi:hypothetical protein